MLNILFNHNSLFILSVMVLLFLVDLTMGLQCYACGHKGDQTCDNFHKDNEELIKKCEPDVKSCLIELDGNEIRRSCGEHYKLDDCQMANGIKYCYCTQNLCNDKFLTFSSPNNNYFNNNDDELDDNVDEEGSGGSIKDTKNNQKDKQPTVVHTGGARSNFIITTNLIMTAAVILCFTY